MSDEKSHDIIFEELTKLIKDNNLKELFSQFNKYHTLHGFNVDHMNEYGNTLLHISCRCRNYAIVKKLIDDHNASMDIQNIDKRTSLHIATIYGSCDSSMYLFKNNESIKNITESAKIIALIIDRSPHILLLKDKDNMKPSDYHDKDDNTNIILKGKHKKYIKFFESIQTYSSDQDDYNLTLSIFASLKKY